MNLEDSEHIEELDDHRIVIPAEYTSPEQIKVWYASFFETLSWLQEDGVDSPLIETGLWLCEQLYLAFEADDAHAAAWYAAQLGIVKQRINHAWDHLPELRKARDRKRPGPKPRLTKRQKAEICRLSFECTHKEIAKRFGVSLSTVKRAIYEE